MIKIINKQIPESTTATSKQRNYGEIVEFLDAHWVTSTQDKTLACIKQLDKAFGNLSQQLTSILVSGTNGKSITVNFTSQLLVDEGLKVGTFCSPHLLTYNERFSINNETISNKIFTELGNEVLNTVDLLGMTPNSYDVLTMMSLLFFSTNKVDVAVFEVSNGGQADATSICTPKIAAITRVTHDGMEDSEEKALRTIHEMLSITRPGTHVISADQSKIYLQTMLEIVKQKGGTWGMPIRKLAPLEYPFEQLHGRCAALAERIAYAHINSIATKDTLVVTGTLLTKQKGQRGRPTLEAKRQSELNPKKTLEQFWKNSQQVIPGRFQLLEKEKPSILLDNAQNLDAIKNLLLGIRLLHYKRASKGLALIVGCNNPNINLQEFLKMFRYFFKKTSGSIIFCPIKPVPGQNNGTPWNLDKIMNEAKAMKIKAKLCVDFKDAFKSAQKIVDERHGLVVITGSSAIVTEYWRNKDVKKL